MENISLSNYSTFKIGGSCSLFYKVESIKNLRSLLKLCEKEKINYRVLGNGSNILFQDEKYNGLVIYFGEDFSLIKHRRNIFKCQSGTLLSRLVIESTRHSYQGLELLIGIPGSVGGAICGNAGCNGVSISDYLVSVTCLVNGKIKKFRKKELNFSYRNSIFKKENYIILEATFKLKKGDKETLLNTMRKELKVRKEKQPSFPSLGCIFKNGENYSAGRLIEDCGLKGKSIGGVRISEKHANIIENFNQGTSKDVQDLINLIKKEVYTQKNILLEEEIVIW